MTDLFDRILLFICCTLMYIFLSGESYVIIPVLLTVFLSCVQILIPKKNLRILSYFLFLLLSLWQPYYLLFLPLMIYDLLLEPYQLSAFAGIFPYLQNPYYYPSLILLPLILFCVLTYYLKYKTIRIFKFEQQYKTLIQSSGELSILQEEKNRSLLENQDYEINLATLKERNRISKEIHDHIGHLLSRSLLQIGALLTISRETPVKEGLAMLKGSISEGMDSIRASIHNIHDESIDLYTTIDEFVKTFTFCPITLEYDMQKAPLLKIKYCFIATIKECLSNIVKHSNATLVTISIQEQPAMYQLIVKDNGQVPQGTKDIIRHHQIHGELPDSMGLQNIADRVKGFQGTLYLNANDGFRLFITIPKEKEERI